jgi:hypothetical protein
LASSPLRTFREAVDVATVRKIRIEGVPLVKAEKAGPVLRDHAYPCGRSIAVFAAEEPAHEPVAATAANPRTIPCTGSRMRRQASGLRASESLGASLKRKVVLICAPALAARMLEAVKAAKDQKAEATRAALLEVGRRLFGRRDFLQTSQEELVAGARLTRGAL